MNDESEEDSERTGCESRGGRSPPVHLSNKSNPSDTTSPDSEKERNDVAEQRKGSAG
jgi:hypothetical protein